MSFIQRADDARAMKLLMKNHGFDARLIAKVETKAAIENIEEIIHEVDGVMIARGDLAYEVSPEAVPVLQRKIIALCRLSGKLSIVATQMLGSMTENPEPTRAEVSDVATATILQADALALRDETANGKYPIEAVKMMKRIINYTERNSPIKKVYFTDDELRTGSHFQQAIAKAIITLSAQVNAAAIVAETRSGGTALAIASQRPARPMIVVTSSTRVAQQLAILYGAKTFIRRDEKFQGSKLTTWLLKNKVLNTDDVVVMASGAYPGKVGTTDTIKVRVL
jgi:pyruvate kinase